MDNVPVAKYRLSQTQLRGLDVNRRPALRLDGATELVKNLSGKPYRFIDGSPGAPAGFNIYVGPTGAYYEVRLRIGKKAVCIALGSVKDMPLARAHELAVEKRITARETGEDPRELIRMPTAPFRWPRENNDGLPQRHAGPLHPHGSARRGHHPGRCRGHPSASARTVRQHQ